MNLNPFKRSRTTPHNNYQYEKGDSKYKIVELSKARITPSVDDFVTAAESANNKIIQNRVNLYDHYEHTLLFDNHVCSLLEKRLDNIANKKLVVLDGDNPVEDLSYFLKSPKFRAFLKDLVMSRFWGFSVFEFDRVEYDSKFWFDYKKLPNKHINPFRKEVLTHQFDSEGISFADADDVLFVGDENDLGILLQVTLLSIYRRYGMFNYANYVDLASENFTILKARGIGDDDSWEKLENNFKERSGGGAVELPEGADLETENNSSPSQNALFDNYTKMLKEELAVLLLGQTMTSEDGSSRSQAEVHQDEQESKYKGDEEYVLDVLNYDFKDYLKIWGFEKYTSPGVRFEMMPSNAEDVGRNLQNYKLLKELGVNFTDEELRKTFKDLIK